MKHSIRILAIAITICCTLVSAISLTSHDSKSKIKFNCEVKFNCTLNFRDQFASHKVAQSIGESKMEFKASGVCEVKNFDRFDLVMSHVNYVSETGEIARIGIGTFDMTGDDDNQLFGTYEGYADLTKDPQDLILFISINGGTGHYEGAKGYLRAICSPDRSNPKMRKLKLNGTLIRESNMTVG